MEHNSMELDRTLIADLVKWYLPLSPARSKSRVARVGEVGVRSVYRVLEADESVSMSTLAGLSRGMGLPVETLYYAGRHDTDALCETGVKYDIIRFVEKQVKTSSRNRHAAGE